MWTWESMVPWIDGQWGRALLIVVVSFVAALLIELLFRRVLLRLVQRTETDLDDHIVDALRRPIYFSVILVAFAWASRVAPLSSSLLGVIDGGLKTSAIIVWAYTLSRIGSLSFRALAGRAHEHSFIQPRTQPLFDISSKLVLVAIASYGIMLAWHINIGAWLASAGIAGLALGFAAKDSLSNLFAGIFIVADIPYKVGDFIVLDGTLRGSVTSIGFRSTRLLTLDDIEIIVPNSVMGNAQIVNESGGPYRRARVAITVECAYGSDVDLVKEVMLACVEGAPHISPSPSPQIRFTEFGGSGLVHQLLVWIERPRFREAVVDDLNRRVYKAFGKNGIEIPYSKHDLFIKELPQQLQAGRPAQASTPHPAPRSQTSSTTVAAPRAPLPHKPGS